MTAPGVFDHLDNRLAKMTLTGVATWVFISGTIALVGVWGMVWWLPSRDFPAFALWVTLLAGVKLLMFWNVIMLYHSKKSGVSKLIVKASKKTSHKKAQAAINVVFDRAIIVLGGALIGSGLLIWWVPSGDMQDALTITSGEAIAPIFIAIGFAFGWLDGFGRSP